MNSSYQKWRASDLSLEGEWRASEEYPVSAIAASTTEGDGRVFTANCDGEIKEWGAGDGAFRQMTVLTVRERDAATEIDEWRFEESQGNLG